MLVLAPGSSFKSVTFQTVIQLIGIGCILLHGVPPCIFARYVGFEIRWQLLGSMMSAVLCISCQESNIEWTLFACCCVGIHSASRSSAKIHHASDLSSFA
jgi:hypothetical protein